MSPKVENGALPDWAINHFVGSFEVRFDGVHYGYAVLKVTLEPDLYNFVGYTAGGFLFISEEVPEKYRAFVLRHELYESITVKDRCDKCLAALKWELDRIPKRMYDEYVVWRLEVFDSLVTYYTEGNGAVGADPKFVSRIKQSLDYLVQLTS